MFSSSLRASRSFLSLSFRVLAPALDSDEIWLCILRVPSLYSFSANTIAASKSVRWFLVSSDNFAQASLVISVTPMLKRASFSAMRYLSVAMSRFSPKSSFSKSIACCKNFFLSLAEYLSACTALLRNSLISFCLLALLSVYSRSLSSKASADLTTSSFAFEYSRSPGTNCITFWIKFEMPFIAFVITPTMAWKPFSIMFNTGCKEAINDCRAVIASSFFLMLLVSFITTAVMAAMPATIGLASNAKNSLPRVLTIKAPFLMATLNLPVPWERVLKPAITLPKGKPSRADL